MLALAENLIRPRGKPLQLTFCCLIGGDWGVKHFRRERCTEQSSSFGVSVA